MLKGLLNPLFNKVIFSGNVDTTPQVSVDDNACLIMSPKGFPVLVPERYDELGLTYVASGNGEGEVETVTYKLDSSIVAVLTLGYDADDNLSSVVRS